jgi:starch synthase
VGDVVRDLPQALCGEGWQVLVATPSYGILHTLAGSERITTLQVPFRGGMPDVEVWRIRGEEGVEHIVLHHDLFESPDPGQIYYTEDGDRPFATDANKFAFFCIAAACWIRSFEQAPDVVHLHDWHAAFYLPVTHYVHEFESLRKIRTVFTIHNLAYQGTRPLDGDDSSLAAWYPSMVADTPQIADPRHSHCINPMAAAIRLADRVSTVSPTYASEICRPSDKENGFVGGEGLESLLLEAKGSNRLTGVLNGCFYTDLRGRRPGWQRVIGMLESQLRDWLDSAPEKEVHKLAMERVMAMPKRRPRHLLTSIGRLVAQKATLLLHEGQSGKSALQRIADELGKNGVIILLGSGETRFEERVLDVARKTPNLIFVCGYSESLAEPLYHAGDLFLMPSSFEPCGISQMLAMRRGQPCIAHAIGGLRDTIRDQETGFLFDGSTPDVQADAFVSATLGALTVRTDDPMRWQDIRKAAAAERFDWASSAKQTIECLYDD